MREATHFSVEPYETTLMWGLLAKLLACVTRGNTWFGLEEVVLGTLRYPPLHIRRDLVWIGGQYGDFLAACRLMYVK
jgi:hypothetical protein